MPEVGRGEPALSGVVSLRIAVSSQDRMSLGSRLYVFSEARTPSSFQCPRRSFDSEGEQFLGAHPAPRSA